MTQPMTLPTVVRELVAAVAEVGGRGLLVGGSVRDHLMGQPVKDFDVEVHGVSVQVLEEVLARLGRVNPVGRAFAVYKLRRGSWEIDVSIPRRDSKQGPGHRGIVAQGDPHLGLVEASRRRDLTINAMMYDPLNGELIDPWGGRVDLAARCLRAVDADTFLEDPLRAVRVVQFAARFEFEAAPSLKELCRAASLDELPPERVLGEWEKLLLRGIRPGFGLALARETDILGRLFPEAAGQEDAVERAMDRAVAWRDRLGPAGRRLALMLLVWLSALPAADIIAVCERLRLVTWLGYPVRQRLLAAHASLGRPWETDAQLRWLSVDAELALVIGAHGAAGLTVDGAWSRAEALGVLVAAPEPLLRGRDVQQLGVRPGPAMGRLLQQVYARQLDGEITSAAEAVEAGKALAGEDGGGRA